MSRDTNDNERAKGSGLDRAILALCVVGAGVLLMDLLIDKHGKFEVENLVGFYAFVGLATGAGFVVVAKVVSAVLTRPEGYYDE